MFSSNLDYISHLQDEIALEGLDGISIEALWTRLENRPNFTTFLPLDEESKSFIWSLIICDSELDVYELPEPRPPLVIFNRYQYMDPELGLIFEPPDLPDDIYKFLPIKETDPKNTRNERGSCATFYTRKNITDDVVHKTLKEVNERYGASLVIVASQSLRNKALCIDACIDQFYDLTSLQYQILERVGRSRTMGEITQGKISLATMGENPKSMFYHRKRLLKMNLITKQPHQQKGQKGQSQIGSLIHLTRFYVERRSKFIVMIQRAIEILKSKPSLCAPHLTLKEEMAMPEASLRKLFKSSEFQKYIKIVQVPHREIYPDATPAEWKCKVKDLERNIRCMKLVNPNVNPADVCKIEETNFDEDDEEAFSGILNQSKMIWGVSLLRQAYQLVEAAGPEGVSQTDIARGLGQTKLDARTICRNLQRRNTVHSLMKDVGRQRVSRYVSHKFAVTGHLTQEFCKERQKMMSMIEKTEVTNQNKPSTSFSQSDKDSLNEPSTSKGPSTSTQTQFDPVESVIQEKDVPVGKHFNDIGLPNIVEELKLTYTNQKRKSPHVTTRMMKRANLIISTVMEHKVIDDAFKLQKLIVQSETDEGLAVKMDKKSLNRLLDKLAQGNFLRIINVKLKFEKLEKTLKFVVHSSVSNDDDILKSAVDQAKMKLLTLATESKKDPTIPKTEPRPKPSDDPTVDASMKELKLMQQVPPSDNPSTTNTPKKGEGLKGSTNPKFVRMQELHKLLFYLVYGYEGEENLIQKEAWDKIQTDNNFENNEDLLQFPKIYLKEVSWKMFIPPLPVHVKSGPGWAFVCDILLRLPLCVFVHLVSVVYTTPDLQVLLDHPIKRNLLLKYLPQETRRSLLQGRRYITHVLDLVNRLCYVGLTQFGHQVMKEKDQVFIYLNQKASLIDTTTSSPGYHQISTDKEYVCNNYFFQTLQDIEQYWYDMWTICMHTPLGGHNCMEGKKVTIQILERKPQILATLTPRTVTEAGEYDNGKIPGDGRGAAGLDSAHFSHLKRNWSPTFTQLTPVSKSNDGGPTKVKGSICYTNYLLKTVHPHPDATKSKQRLAGLRSNTLSIYRASLNPSSTTEGKLPPDAAVKVIERSTKPDGRKRKRGSQGPPPEGFSADRSMARKVSKPMSYQRELKARRKIPKKPYYDEEDKAALRRMKKLRVDWTPAEDSFLLLCKVGCCYLFPNKRSQMITFSLVRSLLHQRFPESRNKTSRACQRRINYIMKNPTTDNNVAIFLEEVRQDASITSQFPVPKLPCNKNNVENVYSQMFQKLMDCLVVKFANTESRRCPDIPDTLLEFNNKFKIIIAASSLKNKMKFKEIETTADIDFYVVNSLIYSSLCSIQDRESYAYQLYLAYQQYPQALLNSVLQSMRSDQMISYKKRYNRSLITQSCLPLSTSPFQLSVTYLYLFNSKYPYEIFSQSWNMFKCLLINKESDLCKLFSNKTATLRMGKKKGGKKYIKKANIPVHIKLDRLENLDLIDSPGYPIIIDHEGGYCAAIVALMAKKRLDFKCIIPEQIIIHDHNEIVPKGTLSIIRRFSDHATLSGRPGDAIDLNVEGQVESTERNVIKESACSKILSQTQESIEVSNDTSKLEKNNENIIIKSEGNTRTTDSSSNLYLGLQESSLKTPQPNKINNPLNIGLNMTNSENITNPINNQMLYCGKNMKIYVESDDSTVNASKARELKMMENEKKDSFGNHIESLNNLDKNNDLESSFLEEDSSTSDLLKYVDRGEKSNSSSRVSLYMLREQLQDSNNKNYLRNQDHFFVNACKISCKLNHDQEYADEFYNAQSVENALDILRPCRQEAVDGLLRRFRSTIVTETTNIDDSKSCWKKLGIPKDHIEKLSEIYKFIESCKELGASLQTLQDHFENKYANYMSHVHQLQQENLVLRVGVSCLRWVTHRHMKHWFIQTNKLTRSMRQAIPRLSGVYSLENNRALAVNDDNTEPLPTNTEEEEEEEGDVNRIESEELHLENNITLEEEIPNDLVSMVDDPVINAPDDTTPPVCLPRTKRKRSQSVDEDTSGNPKKSRLRSTEAVMFRRYGKRDLEKCEEMEQAAQLHTDNSEYEQIDVAVRPWVRLNGSINRRVLDRMLGSLLIAIMERPGLTIKDIVLRFSPALQPAHTHELLDVLYELKCISKKKLSRTKKPSLFNSPINYELLDAESYDYSDNLVIEPTVDCIIKLSSFIGDKLYATDFLSGDRL